jgi:hypothetical protein
MVSAHGAVPNQACALSAAAKREIIGSRMAEESNERDHLDKIVIELRDDHYDAETLWAEPLGNGLYRLRNVPILAYGFSEQDVVSTGEVAGRHIVTGIATPGGHSTYRVFLPEAMDDLRFARVFEPLGRLGCTYERANPRLIGIDVPPEADIYAVYSTLEQGEAAKQWSFEEGHCGHPLRR